MSSNKPNKWFSGVNSIRFILAFIVMISHSGVIYASVLKHSAYLFLRYTGYFLAIAFDGTSAVIAFFIISGFVIHYPNKNGVSNLSAFWIRRFVRIIIPLAVILFIGSFFKHPEKTVVWSVYCELIYYAFYPFLSKIRLSWKNKFILAYLIAALFICIFSFNDIAAFFKQTDINYQGYYWQLGPFLTWIIGLPCWLLGVLIAEHIDGLKNASFKAIIKYRCLVMLMSWFCCLGKFHLHISYILSMNIFALLLYKWIKAEIVYFKNKAPNPLLEKMGKFSYSLYLCHTMVYAILALFIKDTVYTYPLIILIAILTSYCFYLLIEKPSHVLARKANTKFSYYFN